MTDKDPSRSVAYTADFEDTSNPFHPTGGGFDLLLHPPSPPNGSEAHDGGTESTESLIGEFGSELLAKMAVVYSAVGTKHLGAIASEGLSRRKNAVGHLTPIAHEAVFFTERPQALGQFDRTRSIFARPVAPPPEFATFDDSPWGHFTYLRLLVDPKSVLVTDQQIWDDAQKAYSTHEAFVSREELSETVRPFAQQYWNVAVSLVDYFDQPTPSFINPEVIIPFDIPATHLRIFSPLEEERK